MLSEPIVFFGVDGGCLDAYYLCIEAHQQKSSMFLSDKPIELPDGAEYGGGFSEIESKKFKNLPYVYQCGNVYNHANRHIWYERAKLEGLIPLSCVSSHSYIHPTAELGAGVIIYPGVRIMRNVRLGDNVIILPNSVISHDCIIESYSIINSGVILNGHVQCGRNCFIGAGTQIRENVCLIDGCTIGMGSLILNSINETGLYYGKPKIS
jgi:sugar O-acyltransferase (sialic acid O-acetyltransferase NeuD family)